MSSSRRAARRTLAVAAFILLAAPAGAAAVIVGTNGDLAFDRDDGTQSDVYVMAPDGSAERRLDANAPGANDARPDWAPFSDARVGNVQRVEDSALHAARGQMVRIEASGGLVASPSVPVIFSGARPVTATVVDSQLHVRVPADASSGSVCVGQPAAIEGAPDLRHWVSTESFDIDDTTPGPGCRPSQPVAFQSNRSGDYEIWATDPMTGAVGNLTRSPGTNETAPVWSPTRAQSTGVGSSFDDTPLIAFETDRRGNRDIYLLDTARPLAAGSNPFPLTTSPADDANPDWAPDGSAITFESDRDGQKDIWTIARGPDGTFSAERNLLKITHDQPPSYEPTWFSFSGGTSVILFSGAEEGQGCELHYATWPAPHVLPPTAASISTWTEEGDPTKDDSPSWSPYGDKVAFHRNIAGRDTAFVLDRPLIAPSTVGPETIAPLTAGRPGRDRHLAWQSTFLPESPYYWAPLTRAKQRKKRRPRAAQASAAQAVAGCAEGPSAAFSISDATPRVNASVTFDATASRDADGRIAGFDWDLDGDGTFERQGAVVRTSYATPGPRTVALRVADDDGVSDIARRALAVGSVPVESPRRPRNPDDLRPNVDVSQCTKLGTPGRDRLVGTSRRDVLCGLGGDDLLLGRGGNDLMLGGPGADRLHGGAGVDTMWGEEGRDVLRGEDGDDLLRSGPGNDSISGADGADRLEGQGGGDRLSGGAGRDRLLGGGGDDRATGGPGSDRLSGVSGDDRLSGHSGNDHLTGGLGVDRLAGDAGRDVLMSRDKRRDRVTGGAGMDRADVDRRLDAVRGVERVKRR